MRTDFDNIEDGQSVTLFPRSDNPLHKKPQRVMFQSGYFYSETPGDEPGPDYYLGDVFTFNEGWEPAHD